MADPKIELGDLPIVAPGERDYLVGTQLGNARRWPLPEVNNAAALLADSIDQVIADAQTDAAPLIAGLGYLPPVPFASGLTVDSSRFTVSYDGAVYAPVADALPFTTTGTFNPAQWRVIQGVAANDLAASTGAALVGIKQAGAGAADRRLDEKVSEVVSLLDYKRPEDPDYTLAFARANAHLATNGGIIEVRMVSDIYVDSIALSPGVGIRGTLCSLHSIKQMPIYQNYAFTSAPLLKIAGGIASHSGADVTRSYWVENIALVRELGGEPERASGSVMFHAEYAQGLRTNNVSIRGGETQLRLVQVWDSTFYDTNLTEGGTSLSIQSGAVDNSNNLRFFNLHCEQFHNRALESIAVSPNYRNNKITIYSFKAESGECAASEHVYTANTADMHVYAGHVSTKELSPSLPADHALIRFGNGSIGVRFHDVTLEDGGTEQARDSLVCFEATTEGCGGEFSVLARSETIQPTNGIFHFKGAATGPSVELIRLYNPYDYEPFVYTTSPTGAHIRNESGHALSDIILGGTPARPATSIRLQNYLATDGWNIYQENSGDVGVFLNGVAFMRFMKDGRFLFYGQSTANAGRVQATPIGLTSANFLSATDDINVKNKFVGRMCWDTTSGKPVYAKGAGAVGAWVYADGTTAYTPT